MLFTNIVNFLTFDWKNLLNLPWVEKLSCLFCLIFYAIAIKN